MHVNKLCAIYRNTSHNERHLDILVGWIFFLYSVLDERFNILSPQKISLEYDVTFETQVGTFGVIDL